MVEDFASQVPSALDKLRRERGADAVQKGDMECQVGGDPQLALLGHELHARGFLPTVQQLLNPPDEVELLRHWVAEVAPAPRPELLHERSAPLRRAIALVQNVPWH